MLVAVSKVKAVGALPNDVGAQVYGLAALRAGPALRFFEQPLARAEAPLGFVHDQAGYLRARPAFQQTIRSEERRVADYLRARAAFQQMMRSEERRVGKC